MTTKQKHKETYQYNAAVACNRAAIALNQKATAEEHEKGAAFHQNITELYASGAKTESEMVSTAPQQEALEKAALLRPLVDALIASGQENQANGQANSQANDGGQEPEEHKKAIQSA